jgi:hypothetical protein
MKIIAIILIADTILNAILGIIQHKLEKDIDKELSKGVELLRDSIRNEHSK